MSGDICFGARRMSRGEIDAQARKLATLLTGAGVAGDDAVAFLIRNDPVFFVMVEACRLLGARYVPLNWHAAPLEIAGIVEDSGSRVLIGHADLLAPVADCLPASCRVLGFPAPPEVAAAYAIENAYVGADGIARLVEGAAAHVGEPLPFRGIYAYTSGSTGRPKGIRRKPSPLSADLADTYRNLASQFLQLGKGDLLYLAAPLYHTAPNGLAMLGYFSEAADIMLAPKFDPEQFLADVERFGVTHAYIVPTMMVRLLKLSPDVLTKYDISTLRFALSTGSPCPHDIKAAMIEWMGPIFYESYGSSELGFMTLISSAEAAAKPGSVGKIMPGGSLLILDDSMRELPAGESGTIYVSLPQTGDFDYSNSEGGLDNQRFQGHATVGDIGYVDTDGYLFINDRKKDMIISGGANIFPSEIEAALIQMPEIIDCAVFGAPDPEFGEAIVAAVQCRAGAPVTREAVHAFLAGRLARFKFPRIVDVHEALPREDSGKIFKARLREPYWAGASRNI